MVVDSRIEESEGGVIEGILEGLDQGHVQLRTDGKPDALLRIPLDSIRKARLNG
jgi:hypothetical protein